MAPIFIVHRLPFVAVTIHANNRILKLSNVLVDTGSAGTLFKTQDLETIDVVLEGNERLRRMTGVGGSGEIVVEKQITALEIDDLSVSPFTIQLGDLAYGLPLDGILGLDFLLQTGAKIDFQNMTLTK